jgi:hypothetical protein
LVLSPTGVFFIWFAILPVYISLKCNEVPQLSWGLQASHNISVLSAIKCRSCFRAHCFATKLQFQVK